MTSSTTTTSHFTFSRVLLRNRLLRFAGIVRVALFWLGQAGILALIVLAGTVWMTDRYLSLQTPIVAPSVWDELPAKVYAILGKALAMETEGSFVFSPRWAFVTNNSIAEESFVGAVWAKHLCDFFVSKRSAKSDYKFVGSSAVTIGCNTVCLMQSAKVGGSGRGGEANFSRATASTMIAPFSPRFWTIQET